MTVRDEGHRSAISPDGSTLYFVVERPAVNGGTDYEVHVASPENGPSRILAQIPAADTSLAADPSGHLARRQVAGASLTDGFATNLWALPTSGGPLRQRPTSVNAPLHRAPRVMVGRRQGDLPRSVKETPMSCCFAGWERFR